MPLLAYARWAKREPDAAKRRDAMWKAVRKRRSAGGLEAGWEKDKKPGRGKGEEGRRVEASSAEFPKVSREIGQRFVAGLDSGAVPAAFDA